MPNVSDERISLIRNERGQSSGVSLRKWRRWYADGDGQQGQGQDQGQGEGGYNPATLEDAQKIIKALQKRVGDKEREKDEAVQAANQRAADADAERKKKLAEEGNYKALADQATAEAESLRGYRDRAASLEQVIRDSNDSRIKTLPESARDLVPVDYAPEKLQAWLNKNMSLLTKPAPPNFDAGAGSGSGGSGSRDIELSAEEKALAAATGMTIEQYAKAKKATTKQ